MKKNVRKLLVLVAIVITAMLCFAVSASALEATGQCGDNVYWEYNSTTKELVISGSGPMNNYSSWYHNSPFYRSDIKSLVIEEGVTKVAQLGFEYCENLEKVVLPETMSGDIPYRAFIGCKNLKSINIPDGITSIGGSVFKGCSNLTSIDLPDGLTFLGEEAFWGSGLKKLTIPYGVTKINRFTFQGCNNLTDIVIPNNVSYIYEEAFSECKNLTNITLPKALYLVEYRSFYNCKSLTNVYYEGSEYRWKNKIRFENENECLLNANIHYTSSRETFTGTLEDCTIAVVLDGTDRWISEITVDGEKYPVKANLLPLSFANNKGFEVVVTTEDDVVVSCIIKGKVKNYLSSHFYAGNQLTYKNKRYNWDQITFYLSLSNRINSGVKSLSKDLKNLNDFDIVLSKVTLTSSNPKLIDFNGEGTFVSTALSGTTIKLLESFSSSINANVNDKYKIDKNIEKETVTITCAVDYVIGASVRTATQKYEIVVENLNYEKPAPEETGYTENIKEAAKELNKIQNGSLLSYDLVNRKILTKEQLEMIEKELLCKAAMMTIPEKDLKDKLSDKVMKKLFGEYEISVQGYSKDIEHTVVVESEEYGEIEIKFTNTVSKYNYDSYDVASFGSVKYEITGGKGKKSVPEAYQSGFAGMTATTDVESFFEAASKVAQDSVKNLYDNVWGNKANEAADLIFSDSVKKIIECSKYGSFSNMVYSSITAPTKKYVAKCPVDINVYDAEGNLCASVVDSEVKLTCEEADISIDGDVKTVLLYDETFTVEIEAMADGEMQICVEEYANSSDLLRTVTFESITLKDGATFTHKISNDLLGDISGYTLIPSDGEEIVPDSDVGYIHNHVTGEWTEETTATCSAYGKYVSECSVCERTVVDYRKLPHAFTEQIIDSAHLVSAATTESPAVYRYDCANCDAISEDLTFNYGEKLENSLGKTSEVTATQTTSSIKLNWSAVDGANVYGIHQKNGSKWKHLGTVSKLDGTIKNLTPGTEYTFAVQAGVKVDGKVIWSDTYTTINTATKAAKPSNVTATQNTSAIKLTWSAVNGADGYKLFYKVNGKWKACATVATTSRTFNNLKAGAKYTFAIQPYSVVGGKTIYGEYAEYTTATKPATVTAKATSPSKGKISLSWNQVNSSEGYQIWYKKGDGSFKLYKTVGASAKSMSFSNLTSGTKYTFAVRAGIKTSGGNIFGAYKEAVVTVK